MRAALRANVPYIVAPQGSLEPWALQQNALGKRIYGSLTEIPLLQSATCLQCVSAKEVEQVKIYGLHAPTVVIPNGVSLRHFDGSVPPLGRRLGIPPDHKTVLYLSRLNPKKGADILIEAFAQVPADAGATLVIAGGDGGSGYEAQLRQLAKDHKLGSSCIFLGELRGEEKYKTLLGADLFALPSHSEGLPIAVLEAMAARLPVIITHGCNLPEVSEWDAGYTIAPEKGELAATIRQLLCEPERAKEMGSNGRHLIQSKFTWERVARQTIETYRDASARAAA
jgi:glycosyltransferase involved in cell wall biosynthesis